MSQKELYVGNLPFAATEEDVKEFFETVGPVSGVKLISDRETGRPRGFGFVTMDEKNTAAAIDKLHMKEMEGRILTVNEAKGKQPRSPRQD